MAFAIASGGAADAIDALVRATLGANQTGRPQSLLGGTNTGEAVVGTDAVGVVVTVGATAQSIVGTSVRSAPNGSSVETLADSTAGIAEMVDAIGTECVGAERSGDPRSTRTGPIASAVSGTSGFGGWIALIEGVKAISHENTSIASAAYLAQGALVVWICVHCGWFTSPRVLRAGGTSRIADRVAAIAICAVF